MADCRLSVVIPTRNHVNLLRRLLDSLTRQTLPASEFEVIVVDDGSSDETRDFLRTTRFPYALRVIEHERLGPPRARNEGIAAARAPIIACLDDDVVLRDDCFMKALPYFADEKVGIVEATLYIEGQNRPLQIHASAQGFVTAAIFFRREAVRKVGGFDPQFYDPETGLFFRDDADIGFRILDAGYKAIQPPDVVAWHPVQFPSVDKSFQHVRRYMFDPLLYRKHPRHFRAYIERKNIWGISFSRPMHYSSLVFALSVLTLCLSTALGAVVLTWFSVMLAVVAHIIFRYKFQGQGALKFWRQRETAAYVVLPFVYLYWFLRGVSRFGGWKSIF